MKVRICRKCGQHNNKNNWDCSNPECGATLVFVPFTDLDEGLVKFNNSPLTITDETQPAEFSAQELLDLLLSWKKQSWGVPTSNWQALIPGGATKIQEINAAFIATVQARNLSNLSIRKGEIIIDNVSKPYIFMAQSLGDGVLTIMAIRIETKGSDLFLEWKYFGIKIRIYSDGEKALRFVGGVASILALGITLLLSGFLAQKWLSEAIRGRTVITGNIYNSYQSNDAWAFKEAIFECLKESIKAVGIPIQAIKEIHHHHYS